MLKKFLLVSIILFVVVLASGCNKQEPQVPKQEEKQPIVQESPNQEIEIEEISEGQNEVNAVDEESLVYYKIPELGIKFKIEKELADELIYYVEVAPDDSRFKYARFASLRLNEIGETNKVDEHCKVKYGPMGTLIKVKGSPSDYPDDIIIQNRNDWIKEFEDFFVYFSGSQAVCSGPENAEEAGSYMGIMTRAVGKPEKIKLIEKIDE